MRIPAQLMNVTRIDMACHIRTRVDAPLHFLMDRPAFQQVPASRLHGSSVVRHSNVVSFGAIGRNRLQGQRHGLRKVDMMMLHTGWAQGFGTGTNLYKPALTVEADQWLMAQGVNLPGVDFATLDLGLPKRLPDFDWQVQQVLVSNGVPAAENLADFGRLARAIAPSSPGVVRLRPWPTLRAEYKYYRRRLHCGKLRQLIRSSGINLYVQAADNAG